MDTTAEINAGLSRIPAGLRARLTGWRVLAAMVPSVRRFQVWASYGNSSASRETLRRVADVGASSAFDGVYKESVERCAVLGADPTNTVVHEFGHHIDYGIGRIDGSLVSVMDRAEWVALWDSVQGSAPAYLYGMTNKREWFAELFTAQIVPSYTGDGGVGHSTLFYALAGFSTVRADAIRAAFVSILPELPAYTYPTVAPTPPTVTTVSLSPMRQGVSFSQTLEASGTAPLVWSVQSGALPAGLTLDASGVLSGTPTAQGAYSVTVRASNGGGFDDQVLSGVVAAPFALSVTGDYLADLPWFAYSGYIYVRLVVDGLMPESLSWQTKTGGGAWVNRPAELLNFPEYPGLYEVNLTAGSPSNAGPLGTQHAVRVTGVRGSFSVVSTEFVGTVDQ